MKLLILGLPRAGTTSLLRHIQKQKGKGFFEPYGDNAKKIHNYPYPLKELTESNDVVVKQLMWDIPTSKKESVEFYPFPHINPTIYFQHQLDFTKYFDKIILLDRKNLTEHLNSFINLSYKIENKSSVNTKWQESEIPKSYIQKFITNNSHTHLYLMKSELLLLSKKLKIDITWYEDLYGEDRNKSLSIIKSWNLDIDEELLNKDLHPRFKYLDNKKNII